MSSISEFDELYIVSDLHLGGYPADKQIFKQSAEFEVLIAELFGRPKKKQVGLVLNGDVVDFLAVPEPDYFDPLGAVGKLDDIARDASFLPVFDALRNYLKVPNRHLIITLGNHDLELALPRVREFLLQTLAQGSSEARARISLAFDREGFRCKVGKANVVCVHGNDVDTWNKTDFARLEQVSLDPASGQGWIPNAGSQLVIDVINDVKNEHPYVDLLKPLGSGVLPTLLVMEPRLMGKIGNALPAVGRLTWDSLRQRWGFLGEGESRGNGQRAREAAAARALTNMLGGTLSSSNALPRSFTRPLRSNREVDGLLLEMERNYRRGVRPLELLPGDLGPEYLGIMGALWNLVRLRGKPEVLREALENLENDRSFDIVAQDDAFHEYQKQTSSDVHFLVTGHTHLERALRLEEDQERYYYNSGTWVRLIQFTKDVLGSESEFERIYNALDAGTMEALDQEEGLILSRPTVVAIWAEENGTHAELERVVDGSLVKVEGSHFSRS